MKIKLKHFYYVMISVVLILSLLSYEVHLYKYYTISQLFISSFLLLLMLVFLKYEKEYKNIFWEQINKYTIIVPMFIFMIVSTIVGLLAYGYNTPVSVVSVAAMFICSYCLFFIIPIICTKYPGIKETILNIINFFCLFLIAIGIIIYFKGEFLSYTNVYGRAASIYADPNFLAMVLTTNMFLNFRKGTHFILKLSIVILSVVMIIFTGSRGTLVGIMITIVFYILIFSKQRMIKKVFISVFLFAVSLSLLNYLVEIDFFRLYQGSNGRFEMIISALEAIKESPIIGYGYASIGKFLIALGYSNVSTHNSFVDFAYSFGIITSLMYIYFLGKVIIINIKDKNKINYMCTICYMIFNMNTILYNFGGVGISSLLFTLVLGLLNYSKDKKLV